MPVGLIIAIFAIPELYKKEIEAKKEQIESLKIIVTTIIVIVGLGFIIWVFTL